MPVSNRLPTITEIAKFETKLAPQLRTTRSRLHEHHKCSRDACITIGGAWDTVRREAPYGMVQAIARKWFGTDADYLNKFWRVWRGKRDWRAADRLAVRHGWQSEYQSEPAGTDDLLRWFRKQQQTGTACSTDLDPFVTDPIVGPTITLLTGHYSTFLATLTDQSVHWIVTSTPYWRTRDFSHIDQLGMEASLAAWIAVLVKAFGEMRRVLRDDGVLWLVIGDRMASAEVSPLWDADIASTSIPGRIARQTICPPAM